MDFQPSYGRPVYLSKRSYSRRTQLDRSLVLHEVLSLANFALNSHSPSQPTPRAQALLLDSRDPKGHPETFRSCLHPSVGLHVAVAFGFLGVCLHFLTFVA